MKKIYLLLGLISSLTFAQLATPSGLIQSTLNPETGNVGIGTLYPDERLSVEGGIGISKSSDEGAYLSLVNHQKTGNNSTIWRIYNMTGEYGNSLQFWNYTNDWRGGSKFILSDNGDVGIGTAIPKTKLDVNGSITIPELSSINIRGNDIFHGLKYSYNNFANTFVDGPILYGWSGGALGIKKEGGESIALRWYENGNIVISNKLEAREIKVTESPTADFVFEEDYKLPTLQEVEQHIKEKKHLPEIASAKQMEKDGVNIGEFQIQLLQKIEELTLYIIEQNKVNKIQEEKLIQLNKEIQELKK